MKRIKSACICQTIHFMLKDGITNDFNIKQVKEEVANYKKTLERNRTLFRIAEEKTQEYGSVIIKIIKQYNAAPIGDYRY